MIMVWLWNSMPSKISDTCMFLIFGTQSNKRFQKLEMRLKYMGQGKVVQNRELKQLLNMPIN